MFATLHIKGVSSLFIQRVNREMEPLILLQANQSVFCISRLEKAMTDYLCEPTAFMCCCAACWSEWVRVCGRSTHTESAPHTGVIHQSNTRIWKLILACVDYVGMTWVCGRMLPRLDPEMNNHIPETGQWWMPVPKPWMPKPPPTRTLTKWIFMFSLVFNFLLVNLLFSPTEACHFTSNGFVLGENSVI